MLLRLISNLNPKLFRIRSRKNLKTMLVTSILLTSIFASPIPVNLERRSMVEDTIWKFVPAVIIAGAGKSLFLCLYHGY